ncbi:Asp23/Gls24 family envelope stress response protein [Amycolatopsis sacchari]|uniref:Asp23/Gls24 family envelope stress response protein n=1 Tax=Amycolatopsis sacchari TaxID=115433 RepID=UPI003D74E62F
MSTGTVGIKTPGNPDVRAEWVATTRVLAAVAAHAAAGVPGVAHLQPGLTGLAGSAMRHARQRLAGLTPAPSDGVRVTVDPASGEVDLEIGLVLSGSDQAAAVARTVQRAVRRALTTLTGITPGSVSVDILDADPGPTA